MVPPAAHALRATARKVARMRSEAYSMAWDLGSHIASAVSRGRAAYFEAIVARVAKCFEDSDSRAVYSALKPLASATRRYSYAHLGRAHRSFHASARVPRARDGIHPQRRGGARFSGATRRPTARRPTARALHGAIGY